MIKTSNYIITDSQGRELSEYRSALFNFYANEGNINNYAAGYIPSHWHKELEIFALLEGQVHINIENCTYELTAGEGCFINSGIIHSFLAAVPSVCHFRSFVFGAEIVGGIPGSTFDTNYVRPLIESGVPFLKFTTESDTVYFEEFNKAFHVCQTEDYGYEFVIRNALSNIILYTKSLSIHGQPRTLNSVQEVRLKTMLSWIDDNLGNEITVSKIAASANICPRECQRIFRQYLHYSPSEYILKKRIFNAAELLANTDKSITDIALYCGFSSPSYFSKRFREYLGSTPSEYRLMVCTF